MPGVRSTCCSRRPSPSHLREVFEELTDGVEVLGGMETYDFVRFGAYTRERCGRRDASHNHDSAWLLRTDGPDRGEHGRPGRDSVVDDDDHAIGRIDGLLRACRMTMPRLSKVLRQPC